MFEQAELQGTQMGPDARLMQKERLKSHRKSLITENHGCWVILAILAKTAIWVILASHFRARMNLPKKKSHLESGLN